MFGLSPEVTAAVLGVALMVVGQALLMWRREGAATERHKAIDARLKHQDECMDGLREEVQQLTRGLEGRVRYATDRAEQARDMAIELRGYRSGQNDERERQERLRRESDG